MQLPHELNLVSLVQPDFCPAANGLAVTCEWSQTREGKWERRDDDQHQAHLAKEEEEEVEEACRFRAQMEDGCFESQKQAPEVEWEVDR